MLVINIKKIFNENVNNKFYANFTNPTNKIITFFADNRYKNSIHSYTNIFTAVLGFVI